MKEFASCVLRTPDQILISTHLSPQSVDLPAEREKYRVSHSRASGEGNAIPLRANRWRWLISPPASPQSSLITKRYQRQRWWQGMPKGGKKKGAKFADVWKQIMSGVALQLSLIWWRTFLNVSGASSAQWPSGSRETAQRFSRRYGQSSFD